MITEEIVHVNGMPKKLVVFLHGYQDCAEHIERKTIELQKINNIALHIPQAPFVNEVDISKRQWYSIHQFDPDDKRRGAVSWDEFVDFYNRMTVGVVSANYYILQYVDGLLNEYNLSYEDLFLCGFSQGATCAIYGGLMCPHKIGGVISFSGILAAKGFLENHSKNKPDCLLIHGKSDEKIKFEALDFSAKNLNELGCKTEVFGIDDLAHKISPLAVDRAVEFIKKRY